MRNPFFSDRGMTTKGKRSLIPFPSYKSYQNWDKTLSPWLYKSCHLERRKFHLRLMITRRYILSHVQNTHTRRESIFVVKLARPLSPPLWVHNSSHVFFLAFLSIFIDMKYRYFKTSYAWEKSAANVTPIGKEGNVLTIRHFVNRMDRDSWNCRYTCSTTSTFNRPLTRRWRPAVGCRLPKNRLQSHRWRSHLLFVSDIPPFSLCSRRVAGETRPARRPRPSKTRFCHSARWWITRWPQQLLRLENFQVFL